MVKFASGLNQVIDYQIERRSVFWQVDFDLPSHIREQLPLTALRLCCGEFIMGFYADPVVGDVITYRLMRWRVVERQFSPTRYRSKDKRQVPTLIVEWLGQVALEQEEGVLEPEW